MPHINFSNPKRAGGNKGSSGALVKYLEKENSDKALVEQELFFSHSSEGVLADQVQFEIDNNVKGLAKTDQKFYEFSVSFSQKEMEHLKANGGDVKDYVRDVMDEYAKNFNREDINSGKDLKYFAKVEKDRRYPAEAYNDDLKKLYKHNYSIKHQAIKLRREGKEAPAKKLEQGYMKNGEGTVILPGNKKDGDNTHVHVIVSHKDANMRRKLSPLANHRDSKITGIDQEGKIGFNRDNFVDRAETVFDQKFKYDRALGETYRVKLANNLSEAKSKLGTIMKHAKNPEKLPEAVAKNLTKTIMNAAMNPAKQHLLKAWGLKSNPTELQKAASNISMLKGKPKDEAMKAVFKGMMTGIQGVKNLASLTPHGLAINVAGKVFTKVAGEISKQMEVTR